MAAASGRPRSGPRRTTFEVAFDLKAEAPNWPPVEVERLWGEKTAVDSELRLLNVPFFARGVAYGDLVRVRPDRDRDELVFERLNSESGHSTLRITVLDKSARREIQGRLREAGCSWETAAQFASLLAVDVPADCDYRALRNWLKARMADGTIEFQESAISALHLEQVPNFPL